MSFVLWPKALLVTVLCSLWAPDWVLQGHQLGQDIALQLSDIRNNIYEM